jgi:cardiolipin synthase (CMP-forming)
LGSTLLNIPNLITLARLLLVPIFVWLLAQQDYGMAFVLFLTAGLSDALDGYLARRLNQVTQFGALLDAVADKLIIFAALVGLTLLQHLPWWLALTMLGRDLVVAGGALAFRLRAGSLEMRPTRLGKLHTLLAFAAICLVLGNASGVLEITAALPWLFYVLLVSALISGAQYVWVWSEKARRLAGS